MKTMTTTTNNHQAWDKKDTIKKDTMTKAIKIETKTWFEN